MLKHAACKRLVIIDQALFYAQNCINPAKELRTNMTGHEGGQVLNSDRHNPLDRGGQGSIMWESHVTAKIFPVEKSVCEWSIAVSEGF